MLHHIRTVRQQKIKVIAFIEQPSDDLFCPVTYENLQCYYDLFAAGDETLTPDDLMDIFEELLPAQNQSYTLGIKLRLNPYVLDDIHQNTRRPSDRLLGVIMTFLKNSDPRPTWRVIINALRSPVVGLKVLADQVEAAHLPDTTPTTGTVHIIVCLNSFTL